MREPLPLRVRLYVWLIAVGALGTLAWWLRTWLAPLPSDPISRELTVLLFVLAVVASHLRLHIMRGHDVQMANTMHFASLLLFGAPAAMFIVGASTFTGELTLSYRRHFTRGLRLRSLHQILFSTSQHALTVGIGGIVYYALLPQTAPAQLDSIANVWAVPAAAAAMYLANTSLVAAIVGLQRRENPVHIWLAGRRTDVLQEAGLFLLGLITARTAVEAPWMPLVMVLPTAIIFVSLKRSVQLQEQTIAAVEALADVVDRRDRYTFEHSKRVAEYAAKIARAMRLPGGEVETIRLAARVHDLGKIGVPDSVLLKPGALTPEEKALMDSHPAIGAEILSRFPEYRRGRELVLSHHERIDGKGYPTRADGSQLSLGAKIIAVADALDAMTSDRPYRKALPIDIALAELRRGKGLQWAPEVVEAAEKLLESPQTPLVARAGAQSAA
jgi:putative nucleotidyltransferase with HDIG domain